MATILSGDDAMFNAMVGGVLPPSTQQYLEQQRQTPTHLLTQCSQQFLDYTQSIINEVNNSQAMRHAIAAKRAMGQLWSGNEIRALPTIAECQWAPPVMVRWIMADPVVRQRYHEQTVEGYQNLYVDAFPEQAPGPEHYDYQVVMNGVVTTQETDPAKPEWTATTYYDVYEDATPMDFLDQMDVVHSWEAIRQWLKQGSDDPTSRFNASL